MVFFSHLELKKSPQQRALFSKTCSCVPYGGVHQDRPRTLDVILKNLVMLNTQGLLPDLDRAADCADQDIEDEMSRENN